GNDAVPGSIVRTVVGGRRSFRYPSPGPVHYPAAEKVRLEARDLYRIPCRLPIGKGGNRPMKFGHKLTIVLLGVLALVLSLSTLWTQERQFSRALTDLRQTAQEEWQRESAAFQRGLRSDDPTMLHFRAWGYLGDLSRQGNHSLL